jgi:3-dehydroquinate synthase
VIATRLSCRVCGLPASDAERVARLVSSCGLPVAAPAIPLARWLELMGRDKKVADGAMRLVLLESIGRATLRSGISDDQLAAALAS